MNVHFDYKSRLQILSKDVIGIYLEEYRLSWLDVNTGEIFDENYINSDD